MDATVRTCLLALILLGGCSARAPLTPLRDTPLGWFCQRHYVDLNRSLWVTMSLAADGTPNATGVAWRASWAESIPGIDMGWNVPPQGSWFAGPRRVELFFALPRPRKPVSALLYADGALVGQGEVFDTAKFRVHRSTPAILTSLSFYSNAGPVPALHGVRRLELITVEGEERRAAVAVPLPDWAWVDGKVAEALPALAEDARQFESRCERESEPNIQAIGSGSSDPA